MANVTLEKVVKRFGHVEAVREFDLEIADGEFVVLVGPSGCGKSTTLRMVAGLEQVSGAYFAKKREARPSAAACDDDAARALWDVSNRLTGLEA